VALAPGERRTVRFRVHPSRLAFYDDAMRFAVEPGTFRIMVGASSADVRLEDTVTLAGEASVHRQAAIVPTEVAIA
jgi:beta-glucosidase